MSCPSSAQRLLVDSCVGQSKTHQVPQCNLRLYHSPSQFLHPALWPLGCSQNASLSCLGSLTLAVSSAWNLPSESRLSWAHLLQVFLQVPRDTVTNKKVEELVTQGVSKQSMHKTEQSKMENKFVSTAETVALTL